MDILDSERRLKEFLSLLLPVQTNSSLQKI
jgi:hypothetical protein